MGKAETKRLRELKSAEHEDEETASSSWDTRISEGPPGRSTCASFR